MREKETQTNRVKLSTESLNNRVFLWLLVFSIIIQFIRYLFNAIYTPVLDWSAQQLTMSYRYGFIRRGLLGTFTYLIHDCLHIEFVSAIGIVQNIGIILFTVSFLLFFRKLLNDNHEKSFCFIALILISLNLWGFNFNIFGQIETYIIFLTFVMVYLILSDKALILIPILAGICELIHEGYASLYFGIIVALLIYKFCYSADRKSKIKYAAVFFLTGVVVSGLFFYFYFIHPRIDNPDTEAILANCQELLKVNYSDPVDTSSIRYVWLEDKIYPDSFHGRMVMWIGGKPTNMFYEFILVPIINSVILSPLIYMTVKFWFKIIKNESHKGRKVLLILSSLMVFLIVPLIVTHVDQARWFYAIVIYEVVVIGSIFLLNANNERSVLSEITKITLPKLILLAFYCFFYWNTTLFFITDYSKTILNWILKLILL